MLKCRYCGGDVLLRDRETGVCQICGRVYSGDTLRRMRGEGMTMQKTVSPVYPVSNQQNEKKDGLPPWAIVLILFIVMSSVFGSSAFFPIIPFIVLACVAPKKKKGQDIGQQVQTWMQTQVQQVQQPVRQMPEERIRKVPRTTVGERLDTPYDYLDAFRLLPLTSMPFRDEAAEAMDQISALITKEQGISTLLPAGHPYYPTVNDAVQYFLRNTKQILFRLRYCDQNDMSRREEHKAFFRRALDENAALLRDLETFMLELSQMENGVPISAPGLDTLSKSMQGMRASAVPDDEELMHMLYGYQTEFPAAQMVQEPRNTPNQQNFNQLMQ